jgi:hypothetical protein
MWLAENLNRGASPRPGLDPQYSDISVGGPQLPTLQRQQTQRFDNLNSETEAVFTTRVVPNQTVRMKPRNAYFVAAGGTTRGIADINHL